MTIGGRIYAGEKVSERRLLARPCRRGHILGTSGMTPAPDIRVCLADSAQQLSN